MRSGLVPHDSQCPGKNNAAVHVQTQTIAIINKSTLSIIKHENGAVDTSAKVTSNSRSLPEGKNVYFDSDAYNGNVSD